MTCDHDNHIETKGTKTMSDEYIGSYKVLYPSRWKAIFKDRWPIIYDYVAFHWITRVKEIGEEAHLEEIEKKSFPVWIT